MNIAKYLVILFSIAVFVTAAFWAWQVFKEGDRTSHIWPYLLILFFASVAIFARPVEMTYKRLSVPTPDER